MGSSELTNSVSFSIIGLFIYCLFSFSTLYLSRNVSFSSESPDGWPIVVYTIQLNSYGTGLCGTPNSNLSLPVSVRLLVS